MNSDSPSIRTANYAEKRTRTASTYYAAILRSLIKDTVSGAVCFSNPRIWRKRGFKPDVEH